MYATLCETITMGEMAKIHCLLERGGLHPLTRYMPRPASTPSHVPSRYAISLHNDELETGRKILVTNKYGRLLSK